MSEAKLNRVISAATQANGEIRCRVNITTPEGYEWETDYVIDPDPESSRGFGLTGDVHDWVMANIKSIPPFSGEVERKNPEKLTPDPPTSEPPTTPLTPVKTPEEPKAATKMEPIQPVVHPTPFERPDPNPPEPDPEE